jgi:uncharacterized protein YjbJ (UPF0337 family)
MKSSSIWKQTIRIVRLSLATLICVATLSFGPTEPSFAANERVLPTSFPVAVFGLGREVEGKAEQLQGSAQVKTSNKKVEGMAKQIKGRAKYDIGRVEDAANRKAAQVKGMVRNMK